MSIIVGSSVVWLPGWSGVVARTATYDGVVCAHMEWDGIVVPEGHVGPGPVTPFPHVPITELVLREKKPDDGVKQAARAAALEAYNRSLRAAAAAAIKVTWTMEATKWCSAAKPGTLEHFKGHLVKVVGDSALVMEDRWGQTMPVPLKDVVFV